MKILLAGEGRTELGAWACQPPYREPDGDMGVLAALMRRLQPDGWQIVDAVCWKDIRKYRAHDKASAEVRNVLGLALRARDAGCDGVVFSRDRDRDRYRQAEISTGMERALAVIPQCPGIAGGVAIEAIESWILSLLGEPRAEAVADPKARLADGSLTAKLKVVDEADFARIPSDAGSLRAWLQSVGAFLGAGARTAVVGPSP